MKLYPYLIFTLLLACTSLSGQDFGYSNHSIRIGVGGFQTFNKGIDGKKSTPNTIINIGYQIRKLDGRLRIRPNIDMAVRSYELDLFTDDVDFALNYYLSGNYDVWRHKKSSLFVGASAGLTNNRDLIRICIPRMECVYDEKSSEHSPFFGIDLGYRLENKERRSSFEILNRYAFGGPDPLVQLVLLIDIKLR